jgi:TRAP-type C4-dicarboxylate transport system substrate-binding protein
MKKILIALAALALAAEAQSAQAAEPVLLKFGNAGQFGSLSYGMATTPFAEAVTKDSDGTVEVKLFPGPSLASQSTVIDRVKNGVAEIGFGLIGLYPDLFPRTTVAMLPFESTNPHEAGVALMRLLEAGVFEPEMREYKVLALALYANMSVHSKKPVAKLDDLKGQKIAVMSKTMADVLDKLGATPITMPPTEFHQSLQRGVVDAAGIGWPGMAPFKLNEVVSHHVQTSLTGEGNFTLMLRSTYDKLPAKGKAAFDKHAGMPFALQWAKAIQAQDDQGIALTKAANQPIVTLAPDEEARWKARAQPVVDAWVASTPDGAKVLAAYRAEIAKVRSAGAAK